MRRIPSENAVRGAIAAFTAHGGTMRTSDAASNGVHYTTLYWMRDERLLEQLTRGVYRLAELPGPSKHDLVTVAARMPSAIVCLVSALEFHGIGTQIPSAVNIAIGPKDREPQFDYPPVRVHRMSGKALESGVEEHVVDGTRVRVFGVAKTVADCFKFRNKIGQDVALEALQEVVRSRRATPGEVLGFAEIDRVSKIIRPYLEALL